MTIYFKKNYKESIHHGYLISLLICLCIRYIGAYLLMPPMFDMCLFSILAVLGAGIITFDVWNSNNLEYYKKNIYLILFIIFLCITSLANIQYGFFQNLKFIVWTAISFFILYPHGRFETTETRIKNMILFQNILIIFWAIMVIVSLIFYILRVSIVEEVRENILFRLGIVEGRLFGVFVNPNSASIVSFFVMIFSIFQVFFTAPRRLPKAFNILNILLQYIYIVLSESRGTAMVLLVSVVIISFGISYNKLQCGKFRKIFISIILSAISLIAVIIVIKVTEELFASMSEYIKNLLPDTTEWQASRNILTKRVDFVENNDISNLRFKIWLSAAEIFQRNWLLGVSPGNVVTYAKEVLPNTFISLRGYTRSHSVWVGVPLYTGICGSVLMFGFFLDSFFKTLKFYIKKGLKNILPICSLYALIVMLTWIYGLVELEILFVNSVCTFIFWTSLGFVRDYVDF